jgi:protein-L-isoaspartate O-methyltransferase
VRHDEAPEITDPRILTAVRYPWPELWNHDIRRLAEKMAVKAGSKRFGAKLLKMFRVNEDDRSTLKNHEFIEELADAARNFRSYGLSRWDVANIREAILRYMRLWSANIRTDSELREACRAFQALYQAPAGESEIGKLTRELIGRNIPGFFPTPPPVIDRMVAAAELKPGQRVLEPSAGKGDIADAIREAEPEARLEVVEPAYSLRQILELKGFSLVGDDFMTFTGGPYDRIIMNPPFESGADIDHVRHAFDLLAPGGRLVAIMSEGPFFRSDRKAEAFRQWLESVDGHSEKLPDGSFAGKDAFRQTGVATRLVTIEKGTP